MHVVGAEYIEFTRNEMRVLSEDPSRVMLLTARATPADYSSDVDSVWVLVMRVLDDIVKKISKNASVKLQVRENKFYVGTFEAGEVVGEADVPMVKENREARDSLEKTNVDAKLLMTTVAFRRIVKSAEAYRTEGWREHFEYVAFSIDNREGKIVFYSNKETYSLLDVTPVLDWLMQIDGHAKVIYKLPSVSSLLLLGLGDTLELDFRTGGILRVSYTGNYWFLDFWHGPYGGKEEIADMDEILAKPKPVRRLVWRLEGESVRVFLRTLRAVSPFASADKVYMGCVGDDWWAYWKWIEERTAHGFVKMDKYSFQEYVVYPETSSGEFMLTDVINLLKDADKLEAFWDGEPATSMVLVASGPKTATKERKSEALSSMIVPEIKGEVALFSGPADTLRDVCEDAINAKEEFLIFASTPYEITVLGRNNVYYEASLAVDSFKTVEEDFIATKEMERLKTFFNDIPAETVHVGKLGYDIILDATTKEIGASVKIRLSQAEEGIRDALKFYDEYRKPLVAAPAPTELFKVWILADVPQFVGAELKLYGPYSAGQIVQMPRSNADTLVRQNLASLLTIEAQLSRAQAQMEQTGTLKPEYLDAQGRLTREGYRTGLTQLSIESLGFILENPDPLIPDLIQDVQDERAKRVPRDTARLADFFLDKLTKAGVQLPAQYKGEFEKAMDINKTYEENLPLIEKAADDIIKRMAAPVAVAPVPERVSKDEFYRAYDEALYEWIPHFIELHKPALSGNLHYEAPDFEAETLAKFSMDTVLTKWASDISKEKEEQYAHYLETRPEHAETILGHVPERARYFADELVRKTYTELLDEAKAKAKPTVKSYAQFLDEFKGLDLVDALAKYLANYYGYRRDYLLEDLNTYLRMLRDKLTNEDIQRFYRLYPQLATNLATTAGLIGWVPPPPARSIDEQVAELLPKAEEIAATWKEGAYKSDFYSTINDLRRRLGSGTIVELELTHLKEWMAKTPETPAAATPPTPTVPTPTVPMPTPAKPKELSKEEIAKLEDVFKATFMRELGHVPRDVMSEFRVEIDAVKFLPYDQAADAIGHLAMDIVTREKEREAAVTVRRAVIAARVPPAPPTPAPAAPVARVPPTKAEPPAVPLDMMAFPRRISSAETNVFYDAFVYAMYELGVDAAVYMDRFDSFRDAWYSNWFSVLRAFEGMVNDIKAGKAPRYYPRPPIWHELPRDAILHLLATKVYKSIDQLIAALNLHGVYVEEPEIRDIVKHEWAKTPRDSWLQVTPKEYLSETLGIPLEELPD
jgi:hypothetical protein